MRAGSNLLGSYLIAGFEGSTHVRADGRRLDLVAATGHDTHATKDYGRMLRVGIRAARESLRWHLNEPFPGHFDFSAELPRLRAAAELGISVVWDLCHFGWPAHLDPFMAEFPERFAAYAAQAAAVVAREADPPHWFAPMNEISFLAWAGGEVAVMNPFAMGRGGELKRQLVRAAIAAIDAVRSIDPEARFLHPEPLINVATDPMRPHERSHAVAAHEAQFEAWDMLAGLLAPELGGSSSYLDIPGANYYPDNQWIQGGGALLEGDTARVPLHDMLDALHARYGKPILISETGTEDLARARWLRMVHNEVAQATRSGVLVGGVCLYPIVNHPGWEDDRHCRNGLWDYAGPRGGRAAYRPLLREMRNITIRGAPQSRRF
jgi:polysaccharide biosynthesis protein PelF